MQAFTHGDLTSERIEKEHTPRPGQSSAIKRSGGTHTDDGDLADGIPLGEEWPDDRLLQSFYQRKN